MCIFSVYVTGINGKEKKCIFSINFFPFKLFTEISLRRHPKINTSQAEVPDGSDLRSRPNSRHKVCLQTKITRSGIWFERTIVWSKVTLIWGWSHQRSVPDGYGLIRGHFLLEGFDRWRIQAHVSLIREDFERNWVWSETISITFFSLSFSCIFLTERSLLSKEATKKQHSDQRHIQSLTALIRTKGVQLIANAGRFRRKFWLTEDHDF